MPFRALFQARTVIFCWDLDLSRGNKEGRISVTFI
jgi:hypothetical protein